MIDDGYIVSLGQLDKAGCHISIKRGLLRICNDRRRLLTQVWCTANRLYILELDSGIPGTVKFDDGSVVEIEGRGTILFIGKGCKHHKLNDKTAFTS